MLAALHGPLGLVIGLVAAGLLVAGLSQLNWGDAFDGSYDWRSLVRTPSFEERLEEVVAQVVVGAVPREPASRRVAAVFTAAEGLDRPHLAAAREHAANILGNPLVEERLLRELPPLLGAATARGRAAELAWIRARATADAGGDARLALALTLAGWAALLHDDLEPSEVRLLTGAAGSA